MKCICINAHGPMCEISGHKKAMQQRTTQLPLHSLSGFHVRLPFTVVGESFWRCRPRESIFLFSSTCARRLSRRKESRGQTALSVLMLCRCPGMLSRAFRLVCSAMALCCCRRCGRFNEATALVGTLDGLRA